MNRYAMFLGERDEYISQLDIGTTEELNADTLKACLDVRIPPNNKKEPEPYAALVAELGCAKITTMPLLLAFGSCDKQVIGLVIVCHRPCLYHLCGSSSARNI